MQSVSTHSGEMSQDSLRPAVHPKVVLDPAARSAKRMFQTLSMSSVGLELGISVIVGMLFGRWLDGKVGTDPWLMILFLCLGFTAGMRGIVRAMNRADREAAGE
jgi:ATP synthase protein I